MSAADVEPIREMYEAFNRGDYEGSAALLHDEVELDQRYFNVWEVRDRKGFRCRAFSKEEEARRAAGLPPA
jgi:hypothetical protein